MNPPTPAARPSALRRGRHVDRRRQALRKLGGAAAAAAGWAATGGLHGVRAAPAPVPVRVMTPFGYIVDFLEMMNAVAGGHFARAGLEVDLVAGAGAAATMQQLLAGQVKFIRNAGIDTLKLAARGQPVVSIATLDQSGYWFVISSQARPIRSAEQLSGRTLGIVSVGGTTDNYLDLMLSRVGAPAASVHREVVGNHPRAFSLIGQGRIDGFIASAGVLAALRAQKLPVAAFECDRTVSLPAQCYITTRKVIEQEPELVLAFLRGIRGSVEELLSGDYFAVLERAGQRFEITGARNREELLQERELTTASWLAFGRAGLLRNHPPQWRLAAEALREAHLAKVPDVEGIYTNRFIDRVTSP